jgi:hypothetical protein
MSRKRTTDFSSLCPELHGLPHLLKLSLLENKLLTLDDLARLSVDDVMSIPGVGASSVFKIREVLKSKRLDFKR